MTIGAYRFDWTVISRNLPIILLGLSLTLKIAGTVLVLTTIVGLIVCFGRMSKNRIIHGVATGYVEIVRNTPLLVQLFLIYYGLPQWGILLSGFTVAVIVLTFHTGAYVAEIFRAGIESISMGQIQAGKSLGLKDTQIMQHIILPQAWIAIIPALTNQFIYTLKDTPLLAFIGVKEMMYIFYDIQTNTWQVFEVYLTAGGIYLLFSLLIGFGARRLESHHLKKFKKKT